MRECGQVLKGGAQICPPTAKARHNPPSGSILLSEPFLSTTKLRARERERVKTHSGLDDGLGLLGRLLSDLLDDDGGGLLVRRGLLGGRVGGLGLGRGRRRRRGGLLLGLLKGATERSRRCGQVSKRRAAAEGKGGSTEKGQTLDFFSFFSTTGAAAATSFFSFLLDLSDFPIVEDVFGVGRGGGGGEGGLREGLG